MEVIVVRFKVRAEALDRAETVIEDFIRVVKERDPAVLEYQSLRDKNDPSVFLHYVQFQDEGSHLSHRQTQHVKNFVRKLYPLCEDDPKVQPFVVFASAKNGS